MAFFFPRIKYMIIGLGVILGTSCSKTPHHPDDPFEPVNRVVFQINHAADVVVVEPVTRLYKAVVPTPVREGVHNALGNAIAPVALINHVLQGEGEAAVDTFFRCLINTTVGVGGIFDVAGRMGLKERKQDMGQTLQSYGVPQGPYIVLPIWGPSSARDATGFVADSLMDPVRLTLVQNDLQNVYRGKVVLDALDQRVGVLEVTEHMDQMSDPYVHYRSLYWQNRAYQTQGEEMFDTSALPGGSNEDED